MRKGLSTCLLCLSKDTASSSLSSCRWASLCNFWGSQWLDWWQAFPMAPSVEFCLVAATVVVSGFKSATFSSSIKRHHLQGIQDSIHFQGYPLSRSESNASALLLSLGTTLRARGWGSFLGKFRSWARLTVLPSWLQYWVHIMEIGGKKAFVLNLIVLIASLEP